MDTPQMVKSSLPLKQDDMRMSSRFDEKTQRARVQELNDGDNSPFACLIKRMKSLGAFSCVKDKHTREDLGTHVIFTVDERSFGMHLHSVREDGIMRHFVLGIEYGSIADSFTFRNHDELLMVSDQPVVGVSPEEAHRYFWDLPMDQPVSMVTRRVLGKYDGHINYGYYILKGTLHKFEDNTVQAVSCLAMQVASGIHHDLLIYVKNVGRGLRSFKTYDDVFLRVTDGELRLDSKNNDSFYFDVLQYKGFEFVDWQFKSFIIWIVEHVDDSFCYFINQDRDNEIQLIKLNKTYAGYTDWEAFNDLPGIKWWTKSPSDNSNAHIFQSLSARGMFWTANSSDTHLQSAQSDWRAAQRDPNNHIHVIPKHRI